LGDELKKKKRKRKNKKDKNNQIHDENDPNP